MDVNAETNVILKYKRTKMCWVCTSCETENDVATGSCILCGRPRTADAAIENLWTPHVDTTPNYNDRSSYTPPQYNYEDNSSGGNGKGMLIFIWIIVIFAIIGLLLSNDIIY